MKEALTSSNLMNYLCVLFYNTFRYLFKFFIRLMSGALKWCPSPDWTTISPIFPFNAKPL